MLGMAPHAFKVNFCKYTNETRVGIEDATENSGQLYIAALNGTASGAATSSPSPASASTSSMTGTQPSRCPRCRSSACSPARAA